LLLFKLPFSGSYPLIEYGLIQEYFFSDTREKITLNVLAKKYGVSAMSIKRSLKKAQRLLRTYIIQREPHG
jgi:DNA-directed RNA polymerase sigma subunit (sigma70/sigma32)